jgi:hypothetical protein
MALKELRVDAQTLAQITDILEKDPNGQDNLQKEIIGTVDKLWQDTCAPKTTLVLIEEASLEVSPRPAYVETLKNLTGTKGPYKVVKTCKSWVGLSEGVYQIAGCPILTPVSWFALPQEKWLACDPTSRLIMYFLAFMSLVQSICLLLLLL